ncbi:putative phage minor tail protein L [Escherichia coli P0304777.12]|nr:putative phage minor tail protein L [Escherichia coli P0304777.12]
MQDIRQETLNECTRAEQSASVVLWEIDLTRSVENVIFSVMSRTKKVSRSPGRGQYQPYPIQGTV